MDTIGPNLLRWLPAIAVLVFVAGFLGWKWWRSERYKRCFKALDEEDAFFAQDSRTYEWSTEWPFRNVERLTEIVLRDGMYTDDDVRRLRRTFPGVLISHFNPGGKMLGPMIPIQLPED